MGLAREEVNAGSGGSRSSDSLSFERGTVRVQDNVLSLRPDKNTTEIQEVNFVTPTQTFVALAALTGILAAPVVAQKPNAAQAALKAAIDREVVDGDLKGAIALYEKTVAQAGADRATAAKALLRMAACHEKLGSGDSQKIYQRVAREYAYQKESVTIAREKLGTAAGRPGEMTLRKVFTMGFKGGISRDGRYLSYQRPVNEDGPPGLRVRELSTGEDWPVTGNESGPMRVVLRSVIGPDSTQVGYQSCTGPRSCELRISKLRNDGSSYRMLYRSQEGDSFEPLDWSPDGNWIAGILTRADRTGQLAKVSVKDGSLTVLKSLDWRGPSRAFFSPDSRFLAYDMPPSQGERYRDVFVLAVDGSRESVAVTHPSNDLVMGWSPDGSHLLFSSDRDGAMGLWAVAVSDGKVKGSPQLVKSDIGNMESMGLSRNGALFLAHLGESSDIETVTVDLVAGKTVAEPTRPITAHVGTNGTPAWSSDGQYLAYVSRRGPDGVPTVCVRNVTTGTVREIPSETGFEYFTAITWSADGKSIAGFGADLKGREGIYRIDVASGSTVLLLPGRAWNLGFSQDGARLYYQSGDVIRERELVNGTDREIAKGAFGAVTLSPDRKWIAAVEKNPSGRERSTVVIPVAGGNPRTVLQVSDPYWLNGPSMTWTPDSRGLLIRKMLTKTGERSELWHVTVPGESQIARKLELDVNSVRLWAAGQIRVHPDGQQLAYVVGGAQNQIWVLENFLGAVKGRP